MLPSLWDCLTCIINMISVRDQSWLTLFHAAVNTKSLMSILLLYLVFPHGAFSQWQCNKHGCITEANTQRGYFIYKIDVHDFRYLIVSYSLWLHITEVRTHRREIQPIKMLQWTKSPLTKYNFNCTFRTITRFYENLKIFCRQVVLYECWKIARGAWILQRYWASGFP